MRALASSIDVEAASLYYHFPSKQQILFDGFARTMDDMLVGVKAAVASATHPREQLRAVVRFHVLFHIERQSEAFVSHAEMRALTPANRHRIVTKRRAYEDVFCALLDDGVEKGVFRVADTRLTAIAILTLCSGVADWFKQGGRLDAVTVAERYVELIDRIVSCRRKPAASTRRRVR